MKKRLTLLIALALVLIVSIAPLQAQTEPQPGGNYVIGAPFDPVTLDIHKNIGGIIYTIWWNIGSGLLAVDPATREIVPYLAESWEVSDDGLTYTFKLREDVVFHNGDALTAEDYVFTFERIMNPETASPTAGAIMLGVEGVELVDEYTFQINMAIPNSTMLWNFASNFVFWSPYPKDYFEEVGEEEFARNPVSVGPFKVSEYNPGESVILERFEDFTWGPEFTHGGPAYLDTITIRIIPDTSTIMAGMEAGEIDFAFADSDADANRLEESGAFSIYREPLQGSGSELQFNNSAAPFDNVLVRQAFTRAINRELLMMVATGGNAVIQYGPLSETVRGYRDEVRDVSHEFDMERAKELMVEAGYEYDDDGMLVKDGERLTLELLTTPIPENVNSAQVLQQQFSELGAEVTITQLDLTTLGERQLTGDFDFAMGGWGWDNYSLLLVYTSGQIGALNQVRVSDEELDGLINAAIFGTDEETVNEALIGAQTRIVEQAYIAPLYTPFTYQAVNISVEGEQYGNDIWLIDAYFAE